MYIVVIVAYAAFSLFSISRLSASDETEKDKPKVEEKRSLPAGTINWHADKMFIDTGSANVGTSP